MHLCQEVIIFVSICQYHVVLIIVNFVINLKSDSLDPNFIRHWFFAIVVPLIFHITCRISLCISKKRNPRILIWSRSVYPLIWRESTSLFWGFHSVDTACISVCMDPFLFLSSQHSPGPYRSHACFACFVTRTPKYFLFM